jgi:hypothetical protein
MIKDFARGNQSRSGLLLSASAVVLGLLLPASAAIAAPPVTGNGTLVGGLGGTAGYGEIELPRNDDGFASQSITSVFASGLNFYGTTYNSLFVNTNGNFTFASGNGTFTPFQITAVTRSC